MTTTTPRATVENSLRLGHGVHEGERERIVHMWEKLDSRLKSYAEDEVDMELQVKERDKPSQRTTLEAWIAREHKLVANSTQTELDPALIEVRDELIRQITDMKNRSEPRNNRHLRDKH
jgi:ribosome-associated translation inhibitor RaiA